MSFPADSATIDTVTFALRAGRLSDLRPVIEIERTVFSRNSLDSGTLFWLLLRRWPGFIVAENSDRVVGYVITRLSMWPWGARRGGIISLATHPALLRQGIARRLMLAAFDFFRKAGAKELDLEVNVKNAPAISLYQGLGFKSGRLLPNYYGPSEDGRKMTREL